MTSTAITSASSSASLSSTSSFPSFELCGHWQAIATPTPTPIPSAFSSATSSVSASASASTVPNPNSSKFLRLLDNIQIFSFSSSNGRCMLCGKGVWTSVLSNSLVLAKFNSLSELIAEVKKTHKTPSQIETPNSNAAGKWTPFLFSCSSLPSSSSSPVPTPSSPPSNKSNERFDGQLIQLVAQTNSHHIYLQPDLSSTNITDSLPPLSNSASIHPLRMLGSLHCVLGGSAEEMNTRYSLALEKVEDFKKEELQQMMLAMRPQMKGETSIDNSIKNSTLPPGFSPTTAPTPPFALSGFATSGQSPVSGPANIMNTLSMTPMSSAATPSLSNGAAHAFPFSTFPPVNAAIPTQPTLFARASSGSPRSAVNPAITAAATAYTSSPASTGSTPSAAFPAAPLASHLHSSAHSAHSQSAVALPVVPIQSVSDLLQRAFTSTPSVIPQYERLFASEEIDLHALTLIEDEQLKDMNVPIAHRVKLMNAVKIYLNEKERERQQQQQQQHYRAGNGVNTFGNSKTNNAVATPISNLSGNVSAMNGTTSTSSSSPSPSAINPPPGFAYRTSTLSARSNLNSF